MSRAMKPAAFLIPPHWPAPYDEAAADRLVERFEATGEAEARLLQTPGMLAMIRCLGGNSPYLAALALRESESIQRLATEGPEAVIAHALSSLAHVSPTAKRPEIAAALRQAKRTTALIAAIADIGGIWPLETVTAALSDLAEATLRLAIRHLLRSAHDTRDIRLQDPNRPEHNCGFAALAMGLPTEADIAREIGQDVDPDAIHAARKAMRGALGRTYAGALAALHAELADSSPFRPDAAAAGRRALRNVALGLFVDGDVIQGLELAHRQLADADNMTERLGALSAIAFKPDDAREHALEAFGRRYAMEPLILDKWFALQAQIPERETLERVRGLMNHRGFSLANPNRVRALIGGFTANQREFNRADGAGFALLEEVVTFLDPSNPQIAARLLTAMRSWRSLEDVRRGQAEAMLRRIAAKPSLSPDVRDIVTRSLG